MGRIIHSNLERSLHLSGGGGSGGGDGGECKGSGVQKNTSEVKFVLSCPAYLILDHNGTCCKEI